MNEPLPVPSTAIYSRSDGVVAWHSCIDEEAPGRREHRGAGQPHRPAAQPGRAVRRRRPPGPAARHARAVPAAGRGCAPSPAPARGGGRADASRVSPTVSRHEDDAGDGRRVPGDGDARPSRATSAACRSSGPATHGPLTYDVVRDLLDRAPAADRLGPAGRGRGAARPRPTVVGTEPALRPRVPPPPHRRRRPAAAMTALGRPHRPHPRPSRSTARGRCGSCGSSTACPTAGSRCTPRSTWRRSTTSPAPR